MVPRQVLACGVAILSCPIASAGASQGDLYFSTIADVAGTVTVLDPVDGPMSFTGFHSVAPSQRWDTYERLTGYAALGAGAYGAWEALVPGSGANDIFHFLLSVRAGSVVAGSGSFVMDFSVDVVWTDPYPGHYPVAWTLNGVDLGEFGRIAAGTHTFGWSFSHTSDEDGLSLGLIFSAAPPAVVPLPSATMAAFVALLPAMRRRRD
jgi:hypothetical protein